MKNLWLIFIGLCVTSFTLWAQPINPGIDNVFRPDEVAIINLTLSPEDKTFLLDPANASSELYFPADFHMVNSQMDTLLLIQVGIRLRGNTSRTHDKKSFKIDFREYNGGKFFGYKKFNLKPNVNDPSLVREPLTLQFYRNMDVPAARTHPVRFYINDEYLGLYMNTEQVDDEFLELRYGHSDGFLYKCSWGATLTNNGQVFNTELFESEINKLSDTRAEIDNFVKVLNNTSDANFQTEIEKVFNVDRYIRQLAVEALLGHWDGYSYNQNNYYLFYNSQSQLVEFIPYDTDNTWGIDWVGRDWATRDLTQWAKGDQPRPLTKRILLVTTYNKRYVRYLRELLNSYFNEDYLLPKIDAYKTLLGPSIEDDTYFGKAFGFTYSDFLNSFSTGMDNHVKYGIMSYLETRTSTAIEQIPALITGVNPETQQSNLYPNPSTQPRVYYLSSTLQSSPVVYTSMGTQIAVNITRVNDTKIEISLPAQTAPGLYVIDINGEKIRWIYH